MFKLYALSMHVIAYKLKIKGLFEATTILHDEIHNNNNNIIHLYSVFSQWSKDASQIEGKL